MSGMLAVSNPPTTSSDGLRASQASVIGQKLCHDAHQPTTSSQRASIGTSRSRLVARPGWRHSSSGQRSASSSRSMRMNEASLGQANRIRGTAPV